VIITSDAEISVRLFYRQIISIIFSTKPVAELYGNVYFGIVRNNILRRIIKFPRSARFPFYVFGFLCRRLYYHILYVYMYALFMQIIIRIYSEYTLSDGPVFIYIFMHVKCVR